MAIESVLRKHTKQPQKIHGGFSCSDRSRSFNVSGTVCNRQHTSQALQTSSLSLRIRRFQANEAIVRTTVYRCACSDCCCGHQEVRTKQQEQEVPIRPVLQREWCVWQWCRLLRSRQWLPISIWQLHSCAAHAVSREWQRSHCCGVFARVNQRTMWRSGGFGVPFQWRQLL